MTSCDMDGMDETSIQRLRRAEKECNSSIDPPLVSASSSAVYVALKRKTYSHWEKGVLKSEVGVQIQGRSEETMNAATIASKCIESEREPARSPEASKQSTSFAHSQLYVLSSHRASLSSSSSLLYLPPATHFLPLDPAYRLIIKPSTENYTPTFSFFRLQMLANTAIPRKSTLLRLAGLHNQVQGPPQSPAHWRQAFETESDDRLYESSSSVPDSDTDGVDLLFTPSKDSDPNYDRRDLESIDDWPITEDAETIELAFDDSFEDPCNALLSPTLSDSSNIRQSPYQTPASLFAESNSDCTCGHQKHFVLSQAEEGIQSGMSEECVDGSDVASAVIADSLCANAECIDSEASSMRATMGTTSFFEPLDSRTSSAIFLPESDRENGYFGGTETIVNYERTQGDQSGDEDDSNDCHRVYYPIESTQRYSMPGEGPRSLLSLGSFFRTARRRVSSYGSNNSVNDGRSHLRRGRSETVRPLALNSTPYNSEVSFVAGPPYDPSPQPLPELPIVHAHETPEVRDGRDAQNTNFFRRLSLQLVGAKSVTTAKDDSPASFLPSISDMRSSSVVDEEVPSRQTRKHRLSGKFLLRNFSLAIRGRNAHKRKNVLERG